MDQQNMNYQPQYDPMDPYNMPPPRPQQNGMSIAALVLGIIGIITCCTGYFGIILGIVGLILGIIGQRAMPSKLGVAGIVLSAIAIAIGIFFWILIFVFSLAAFQELIYMY